MGQTGGWTQSSLISPQNVLPRGAHVDLKRAEKRLAPGRHHSRPLPAWIGSPPGRRRDALSLTKRTSCLSSVLFRLRVLL